MERQATPAGRTAPNDHGLVAAAVTVRRATPAALREAMKRANGDAHRLKVLNNGSVLVGNSSRFA
jgi:hypothetical protein